MPFLSGLLLTVAYIPPFPAGATDLRWGLAALLIPVLIRPQVPKELLLVGLLLLAWAALSLLWTPNISTGLFYLIQLYIIAGWLFIGSSSPALTVNNFLYGVSAGLILQLPLVVVQYFGVSLVPQMVPPAGLFINREVLGEIAALLTIWNLAGKRPIEGILLGAIVLLCQSRVGVTSVAVGLICVIPPRSGQLLALFFSLLLIGLLSLGLGKLGSFETRLDIWGFALQDLHLIGRGIGAFATDRPFWEFTHSDIIQMYYELGLPAIGLAGAVACWALKAKMDLAGKALLVGCLVEAAVSFPLHTPLGAVVVALISGHLATRRMLFCRSFLVRGIPASESSRRTAASAKLAT